MIDAGQNECQQPLEPCFWRGCGLRKMVQKIRESECGEALRIGQLDVVPVEPVQLIEVKDRGRGCDALERKDLRQFGEREGLCLAVFCAPAKQCEVIYQSFGQVAHLAEAGDGCGSVAL